MLIMGKYTRFNALAWNPMEAFNFTVANEDCNLYSYDMRKFTSATCVHQVRTAWGSHGCISWNPLRVKESRGRDTNMCPG